MKAKKAVRPARSPNQTIATKKPEFSDLLPGDFEGDFRRALGKHNLHLNLLEISSQFFAQHIRDHSDERLRIRQLAKQFGFHSLHPEAVSIASARSYLISTHVAYVFSAGDALCKRIRSHNYIRSLKTSDEGLFNSIDQGDFVTKTLALVALASMAPSDRCLDTVNDLVIKIQGNECFSVVNYYRLVRNEELHSIESEIDKKTAEVLASLPRKAIQTRYKFVPNDPDSLNTKDALLCSRAWQDVAKWLCRYMLNDDEVRKKMLVPRFGNLAKQRRDHAARAFMKQALLYSEADINATMAALKWL